MEHPITEEELEACVVRNCAPTIIGAKPASMFTFTGDFTGTSGSSGSDATRAGTAARAAAARRLRLASLASVVDRTLAARGVRIAVLAWRSYGAIVYVWRPALLTRHLADPRIRRALAACGYRLSAPSDALDDEAVVEQVAARFGASGVPHEIGFFLGYPYEDVTGFIEHRGRDFICCGCWKVYANARTAIQRFARYKRCTRRCCALSRAGATLLELATPAELLRSA